jgi:hypothetical protein
LRFVTLLFKNQRDKGENRAVVNSVHIHTISL